MTETSTRTGASPAAERKPARRRFLAGATAATAGVGTLAFPAISVAQSPVVLKMQGAWGPNEIFTEMAQQYVTRVNEMASGRMRLEYLPTGAVVKTPSRSWKRRPQRHDRCRPPGPRLLVRPAPGRSLFGTGPVWGGSATNLLSWIHRGGGKELYNELVHDILDLNVVGFFGFPMPAQPFGWFKNPVTSVADVNGLRYRTVGLAADLMAQMGMSVTQLPGGEIVPAMERGVIDAFEFNNPSADRRFGAQDVAKNYMLSSYHQASECFEINFNRDVWEDLDPDLQAILEYGVDASATSNTALALDQYSTDLAALRDEHGVTLLRTPSEVLARQIEAWDTLIPNLEQDDFIRRAMESQRAWTERTVFYQLMNDPDYKLAYDHYFPGRLPF